MVELTDAKLLDLTKKNVWLMDWILKTGNLTTERDQVIYSQLMFYMNSKKLVRMGLMKCNGVMERSAAKRWSVTQKGKMVIDLIKQGDDLLKI
jgi:hypothetical protein